MYFGLEKIIARIKNINFENNLIKMVNENGWVIFIWVYLIWYGFLKIKSGKEVEKAAFSKFLFKL